MCYKILPPLVIPPESFHENTTVAEVTTATEVEASAGHRSGGDGGGGKKKCVCSPSKHPRSFKCSPSTRNDGVRQSEDDFAVLLGFIAIDEGRKQVVEVEIRNTEH
ncbi:hypothetical protein ISN44_As06g044320 [Arabidopsis suecica]|uniref:Uncharacterized protein n=1 Tax=Arabidopsis suecica TaxID=45249 RepID=A0A8T2CLE3_ARASU|nr:hypothetical protein ISN44_As06g044320 [Arabidopsis suecica]